MSETVVRKIEGDEMLDIMHRLTAYAFRPTPPLPDRETWRERAAGRRGVTYYALFVGRDAVASGASSVATQNVRGRLFPMSAIWGVATAPAARRSGYARRLLAALLAEVREHGQPVSCLYPFRESFYERLGYATFPLPRDATLRPDALGPALRMALPGQVTQHLTADVLPIYDAYVRKLQKRRHGMAVFDHPDEKAAELFPRWVALARVNGEVEGMMQYTLEGDQVTQLKMKVGRFYYHTPRGRYLLLNWIARHVDQASEVELSLAPDEWPETWLADMQVKVSTAVRAPMGRVLNMSGLSGMATGPGRITVALSDDFCPWNEGIWQLETVNGRLQVSRGKEVACTLTAQAVAGLIYGTHDPADFPLRGWGDPTPDQAAQLRAMFPPRLPFLHEYF